MRIPYLSFISITFSLIAVILIVLSGNTDLHEKKARAQVIADKVFFDDQLPQTIHNWSWGSQLNSNETTELYAGTKSIGVTLSPWGAFYLHTDTDVDATVYDSLQFAIKAGSDEQRFALIAYNANNQQIQNPIPLSELGGNPTKSSWKLYTIPVSKINPTLGPIKGIAIQEITGKNHPKFFIDEITFRAKIQPEISSVPSITVSPASSKKLVIYNDNLNGFENWTWGGYIRFDATSPIQNGKYAIAFTANPWSGLYLHTNNPIDAMGYTHIEFSVFATQSDQKYSVNLRGSTNNALGDYIPLENFGGQPIPNSWKTYKIPLTELAAINKKISGIVIKESKGVSQPTIYIDDIALVGSEPSNSPTIIPVNPSPTAKPSPTDSQLTTTFQPITQSDKNPFSGMQLYVQPDNNAKKTADVWRASGRSSDADHMMKIANSATAIWVVGGDPYSLVNDYVVRANNSSSIPVIVSYNIPGRDCGKYSQGGSTYEEYKSYITRMADGIGNQKAVIVLEPDALGLDCLQNESTYSLMRFAIETLEANPNSAVYIEASTWVNADTMADRLNRIGIKKAQGFAVNISGYNRTENMIQFGNTVSEKTGGKHFIIDTSRNGNGPYDPSQPESWCNPPDRALGPKPTADTGNNVVDAFLWIKVPGESDGSCRSGPTAGQWWPEYALGLAQRADY